MTSQKGGSRSRWAASYFPLGDAEASLYVAVPPELEARFYDAPLQQDVQLTLAMDFGRGAGLPHPRQPDGQEPRLSR